MGGKSFFVVAILVFAFIVIGAAMANADGRKVEICHFSPDNPDHYYTKKVGKQSLRWHLKHGDILGSCDQLGNTDYDDGDDDGDDDGYYHGDDDGDDVGKRRRRFKCRKKVKICHFSRRNPDKFRTIKVRKKWLWWHLKHGAKLGSCSRICDRICDDGDACTIDHYGNCEKEGCAPEPRETIDCSDGDLCTEDTCDPVDGCINTPIECDDEDLCTVDTCFDGDCVFAPVACPEGESCDSDTGECGADSTNPNPECEGSVCGAFLPCDPAGGCTSPICTTIVEGGGICLEGTTPCSGLQSCNSSSDCDQANGEICVRDTCCPQVNVCLPPDVWCVNIPANTFKASETIDLGPTIGGF